MELDDPGFHRSVPTGYCPDLECWPAVAATLDPVGLARPDRFTHEVEFRRCPG
jgi:hypothetical protein